jgi:hypothetical protein
MAMKKAASKKAAAKKGDEPVRVGRAKEQKVKGFISDPSGWMDPKVFRTIRTNSLNKNQERRVPKDADAKKYGKTAGKEAKKLVEQSKKKYGTKFVVGIGPDTQVYLEKAGATLKGQKAQSARMTAQAKAAKKKK